MYKFILFSMLSEKEFNNSKFKLAENTFEKFFPCLDLYF